MKTDEIAENDHSSKRRRTRLCDATDILLGKEESKLDKWENGRCISHQSLYPIKNENLNQVLTEQSEESKKHFNCIQQIEMSRNSDMFRIENLL
jgi:hypothetical protein